VVVPAIPVPYGNAGKSSDDLVPADYVMPQLDKMSGVALPLDEAGTMVQNVILLKNPNISVTPAISTKP
jgi:hypothetical protein